VDLKIGEKIRSSILDAIKVHDKLLLIVSGNSIKSRWVEDEVKYAFGKEEEQNNIPVLFPIRLDNSIFDESAGWAESLRNARNIGDFSNWKDNDSYNKSFDKLIKDLKAELKK